MNGAILTRIEFFVIFLKILIKSFQNCKILPIYQTNYRYSMSNDQALLLKVMRQVVVAVLSFLSASQALADDNPIFHLGICELKEGSEATAASISSNFDICLNGRAGGQFSYVSGNSKENFVTSYATGTSSLHVTEYLSLFAEGYTRRRFTFDDTREEEIRSNSDMLLMRVGNAALHGYSFAAGKFRAPFGIGISEASQSYLFYADDFHWKTYDFGTWVTWDDLKNIFLDASLVTETVPKGKSEREELQESGDWGGSLRLGYDFSAIEGARLVGSLYGQKNGLRRTGVGFINVNSRGDTNWVEFVRTRSSPDGKQTPFRQVIKFGYQSSWRNASRWSVNIEEDRGLQRLGEIAHHISFFKHAEFNLGILMRRSLSSPYNDRWHATSGIEVFL